MALITKQGVMEILGVSTSRAQYVMTPGVIFQDHQGRPLKFPAPEDTDPDGRRHYSKAKVETFARNWDRTPGRRLQRRSRRKKA